MNAYFSRFPGFEYNFRDQEELEFGRLREIQGWNLYTLVYKDEYRKFLTALLEEKGDDAALDKLFITRYPNFDYNMRASPEDEFLRLQLYKGWCEYSAEFLRERKLFEDAYDRQFSRDVDSFFNRFPEFDYNPRSEAKSEFNRLRKYKNWFKVAWSSHEWRTVAMKYAEARQEFFQAFVADFKQFFGPGDKLENWIYLCDVLRVHPTPQSIVDCQKALGHIYVNIYDLYHHVGEKVPLDFHPDLDALREYSLKEKKIFPLEAAEGTCMEFLLRKFTLLDKPDLRYDSWPDAFGERDSRRPSDSTSLSIYQLARTRHSSRAYKANGGR